MLVAVSKLLERRAAELRGPAVVLSTFQTAPNFTPATARRYAELVDRTTFVVALGADLDAEPVPGLRGGALAPGDPIRLEWDVVVVGPHFAAALVARDLGHDVPEPERTFDYVLTHDRGIVLEVARALMRRAVPPDVSAR